MRIAVAPYARVEEDAVRFLSAWHVDRAGHSELLGDHIHEWDYSTTLTLRCEVEINMDEVRRDTHQTSRAAFSLVISASSSATRMGGPVWSSPLRAGGTDRVVAKVVLAGHELGGRLDLTTRLVVTTPAPTDDLGPSQVGSVVWRHKQSVLLEGDGEQFPTESADLSNPAFGTPRAGWILEVHTDDLDVAAAAAVRLVVNEANPVMRRVLDGDESADAVQALEVMRWDVARQLIDLALGSDEFVERAGAFDDDTLGWLLNAVLTTHFSGETPRSLRAMRESEPGRFEATLQDASRVLG